MFESKHKRLCVKIIEPLPELEMVGDEIRRKDKAVLSTCSVWATMRKVLQKDKSWKVLPGIAPQGALSRRTQKLVDRMPEAIEGE